MNMAEEDSWLLSRHSLVREKYLRTRQAVPPGSRRNRQDDDIDAFGASHYNKARAVREHYQARLAKLEFEEKTAN